MAQVQIMDRWLYQYIPLLDEIDMHELEDRTDTAYEFTGKFKRKMKKLIRKEAQPWIGIVQRVGKRVAIFGGIVILTAMAVTMSVEAYRTRLFEVIGGKEYRAGQMVGISMIDDYDTVIEICSDACEEFVRAVQNGSADFTDYIRNENLLAYMNYHVESYPHGFSRNARCQFLITKAEFKNDYILVQGVLATYEGEAGAIHGEISFLLQNDEGTIVISEWYWEYMDSPDVNYRGSFAVDTHRNYWEDAEKCGKWEHLRK